MNDPASLRYHVHLINLLKVTWFIAEAPPAPNSKDMAPVKRPSGSSSQKSSRPQRHSSSTSFLRRAATSYRRLRENTTNLGGSGHKSPSITNSSDQSGHRPSNNTNISDHNASDQNSRKRKRPRLSGHHHDMASPQGVKRSADALFVATNDMDEEIRESEGKVDLLTSYTALPTPTTPTTPHKRFKNDNAEETDIIAKLKIRDDGTVAPYDAFKIEGRPHLAYYSRSFPKAEQLVSEAATLFLKAADEQAARGYQHVEISNVCKEDLKQLLKVQELYPKLGSVALLGPAGAGKSSLINALLNEEGIAIESGESGRGTNLVHELVAAHPRQKSKFQIAVPFYDESQVRAMVQRHCKHIFECINKIDDLDDEEGDVLQDAYSAGIDFFVILLCDLPDFKTKQDAMDYFDSRQDDPIGDVVEHLTGFIEEFKQTRTLHEGIEYHDAEDEEGLANIFRRVSRVPRNKEPTPHPWPIVTKIQIRFDNELLKAGLVIGDTPGMTDGNQDVVNATTRYLDSASVVLLVEEKKRLTANKTLDINLRECLWRGKHGDNIQLVLTAIDKTEGKVSHHRRADLLPQDLQELEDAENVVSTLQAASVSISQRKNALMASESMSTLNELRRLDKELSEMPIRIKHAQAKVKQVAVKISIRETEGDVKAKLRDFGRERKAPNPAVHGVSNKDYQVHRAGYEAVDPPSLDVRGTGIPGLRHMLYQKAAAGKASTLRRVCQVQLPTIFQGIIGILTKSRLERKQEVSELIEQVLSEHITISKRVLAELKAMFVRRVSDVIDNNQNVWEQRAGNTVWHFQRLAKGNPFHAFVRQDGLWRTKDEGEYSWNDRIQNVMGEKLADGFDSFEDDVVGIETNNAANVKELFDKLEKALNGKFILSNDSITATANIMFQSAMLSRELREPKRSTNKFTLSTTRSLRLSKIFSASCVKTSTESGIDVFLTKPKTGLARMSPRLCSRPTSVARRS